MPYSCAEHQRVRGAHRELEGPRQPSVHRSSCGDPAGAPGGSSPTGGAPQESLAGAFARRRSGGLHHQTIQRPNHTRRSRIRVRAFRSGNCRRGLERSSPYKERPRAEIWPGIPLADVPSPSPQAPNMSQETDIARRTFCRQACQAATCLAIGSLAIACGGGGSSRLEVLDDRARRQWPGQRAAAVVRLVVFQ